MFQLAARLRARVLVLSLCPALLAWPAASLAQEAEPPPPEGLPAGPDPTAAAVAGIDRDEPPEHRSAIGRFLRDVGHDYTAFFSTDTAAWYVTGGAAAGMVHIWDQDINQAMADPAPSTQQELEGGDDYGNLTLQVPLAVGWWVTGRAMGSARTRDAGRDLLRAQISATSWNYALKFAVGRTRPNGDPRSFPSGHATAAFATAMVLQDHYGWKVGVPFFAAATYTAISRLSIQKHWASDVTMGAFVGIASARTVTLHLRQKRVALAPFTVPGGWGVGLVGIE